MAHTDLPRLTKNSHSRVYNRHISVIKMQAQFLIDRLRQLNELTVTGQVRLKKYADMAKVTDEILAQHKDMVLETIRKWKDVRETYTSMVVKLMDKKCQQQKNYVRQKAGMPERK